MKHTGGCHCGRVRFEVYMTLKRAISCNCSICMKRGSLLDFVSTGDFNLLSGAEHLTDYQFNTMKLHHLFCGTCGILPFARGLSPKGQKTIAINLRCLDGIDLKKLEIFEYDGRSR